jgi:hypothetical protein
MIDPLRERHLLPMSTLATRLRGRGRIDFDERSASFFRFARELGKECRPRGITDAFRKTMIVEHSVHTEVFYADDPVGIDNLAAFLMGEVLPPKADTLMDTRNRFTVLTAFRCALSKFAMFTLYLCQCFLFLAKEPRVCYLFAIGEGSKGREPHINTDLRGAFWQSFRLDFAREVG